MSRSPLVPRCLFLQGLGRDPSLTFSGSMTLTMKKGTEESETRRKESRQPQVGFHAKYTAQAIVAEKNATETQGQKMPKSCLVKSRSINNEKNSIFHSSIRRLKQFEIWGGSGFMIFFLALGTQQSWHLCSSAPQNKNTGKIWTKEQIGEEKITEISIGLDWWRVKFLPIPCPWRVESS